MMRAMDQALLGYRRPVSELFGLLAVNELKSIY